ncbi:hypothetical protein BC829DRAFT_417387 [Chytridium lagenaria]|nr:hypothetical protein BC829DRAFT_417387 [Chytridium lagenaria]
MKRHPLQQEIENHERTVAAIEREILHMRERFEEVLRGEEVGARKEVGVWEAEERLRAEERVRECEERNHEPRQFSFFLIVNAVKIGSAAYNSVAVRDATLRSFMTSREKNGLRDKEDWKRCSRVEGGWRGSGTILGWVVRANCWAMTAWVGEYRDSWKRFGEGGGGDGDEVVDGSLGTGGFGVKIVMEREHARVAFDAIFYK